MSGAFEVEACHGTTTATQVSLTLLPSHSIPLSPPQVREVSLQLLVSYPSLSFVTMMIDTPRHSNTGSGTRPGEVIRPLIESLLISSDPSLSL